MEIDSRSNMVGLQKYFDGILTELSQQKIVAREFGDFAGFLPSYDGGLELTKEDLEYLSEVFERYQIGSQPRVKRGVVRRGIDAPIYLYEARGVFDHASETYRYAQVVVQIAVIMARIDGVISAEEVDGVTKLVSRLNFLNNREKIALTAHARFLMHTSIGVGGGEQTRSHLKIGINREYIVEKIKKMSPTAQEKFRQVAIEIAVADEVLDSHEVSFLQDIYRAIGMSARGVKSDLEKYAKVNHIDLKAGSDKAAEFDENSLEEIGHLLNDLIIDFED